MKKMWIAFAIAMAALMVIASPALAWGNTNVNVDCSDIDVTDDTPAVGTTITFSGTVDIVSTASKGGLSVGACADSEAWYKIYDPNGIIIYSGNQALNDWDYDLWGCASANASQTYTWSQNVYLDMVGDYVAEHGGEAYAENGHLFLCWWIPNDSDYDSCSANRTVTSHGGAGLGMVASTPRLVIQLPAGLIVKKPLHSKLFFPSDGWGDPTTDFIAYSDGIWQVEIAVDTMIQLDGEWHRNTWIEVDEQGNVIGRYGSDGHIIAEEIGLSQPITVTKVG